MPTYRIVMTPDAEADVKELRDYIADVLMAPGTALAYVRAVRKEIASLSELPERYRLMDEEPWHSSGVRRVRAKSFFVYYRVDEAVQTVYVLNVIFARRDQLKALSQR